MSCYFKHSWDVGTTGTFLRSTCCYELMPLESDNRTTLVLSNTRELDRVPNTK